MQRKGKVRVWARVAAGCVAALSAIASISLLGLWLVGYGVPQWPWYQWAIFIWATLKMLPLFGHVAVTGRAPTGWKLSLP